MMMVMEEQVEEHVAVNRIREGKRMEGGRHQTFIRRNPLLFPIHIHNILSDTSNKDNGMIT